MLKKALFVAAAFSFLSASANAEWKALNSNENTNKVSFDILKGKNDKQIVSISVPGYEIRTQVVDGQKYSVLSVPGYPGISEKGNPDVPVVSANFLIRGNEAPKISVIKKDVEDIQLEYPLLSSKGHFTRDIAFDSVPYTFGDTYDKDAFYPQRAIANVSQPFSMQSVKGVNVAFNLFQYNPVSKVLRVNKNVIMKMENDQNFKTQGIVDVPSFMGEILSESFVNFDKMSAAYNVRGISEKGRMVIICHDDFVDAIMPLVVWKKKSGIPCEVVKMSEVGSTADDVKAFVKKEYAKGTLSYLHLVGDVEHVPTLRGTVESAHSDQSYGLLEGDDWFLDIVVSRFSAKNKDDVAYQVAKTVSYEAYPEVGAKWYKKGTGIASNEGNPKDWEYCDKLGVALKEFGYDSIDKIYDPSANPEKVAAAVNDGRSVINYIGHGSSSMWVSSRFSNTHIKQLTNGNKLPYIWSVACVNGAFAGYSDCFAETWLKAGAVDDVKGAVAIAAASTNMQWVPPLHWQAEINIVLLKKKKLRSFGALSLTGMAKLAEVYGNTSKSFKMFVEQTNNFGDGSLVIRYDTPKRVAVNNMSRNDSAISASITREGEAGDELIVTVYNKDMSWYQRATTDANGNVNIELENAPAELYMTVTGDNVVPVVDQRVN